MQYFHIMQIIQTSTHEKAYLLDSFLYHWCVGLRVVRLYFCCLVLDARQCLALHSRRHLEAFLLFWTDSYKHNTSVYYPFSIKNTWRYSFQFIFISKKQDAFELKNAQHQDRPKGTRLTQLIVGYPRIEGGVENVLSFLSKSFSNANFFQVELHILETPASSAVLSENVWNIFSHLFWKPEMNTFSWRRRKFCLHCDWPKLRSNTGGSTRWPGEWEGGGVKQYPVRVHASAIRVSSITNNNEKDNIYL